LTIATLFQAGPNVVSAGTMWTLAVPLALALAAIYLRLPRAQPYPWPVGVAAGVAAILLGGWLLLWGGGLTAECVLFYFFTVITVVGAWLLVTQLNPVHAALAFALVVLSTCGLFLLRGAPFLMAATVIVYAGAIIVTFLFVIMLDQQSGMSDADHRSREPLLSSIAGTVLLGALVYLIDRSYDIRPLDALLARASTASTKATVADINAALGNERDFFLELQHQAAALKGGTDRTGLEAEALEARSAWEEWRRQNNAADMGRSLERIVHRGAGLENGLATLQPHGATLKYMSHYSAVEQNPGENVAPLGRTLFTDYLLAVELGGTLLLIATIGAIAIAGRRTGGLR
jgi:NADH:ubiquinone oxidoreductase subunit 6 (subunit J)